MKESHYSSAKQLGKPSLLPAVPPPASGQSAQEGAETSLAVRSPFHASQEGPIETLVSPDYLNCSAEESPLATRWASVSHSYSGKKPRQAKTKFPTTNPHRQLVSHQPDPMPWHPGGCLSFDKATPPAQARSTGPGLLCIRPGQPPGGR